MITKMTNYSLIMNLGILNKFSFVQGELGRAIAKTKSRMFEKLNEFKDKRQKLVEEYGTLNENGEYVVDPSQENYEEFIRKSTEITDESTEIDIEKISKKAFDSVDIYNPECMVVEYEILERMFVDPSLTDDEDENKEK